MKINIKSKAMRAAKRDFFAELGEGVTAIDKVQHGKRTHALEYKSTPKIVSRSWPRS